MNPKERKIIFLNSYLPRTGHNFAAQVIEIFSEHKVFSHPRSETRLARVLDNYFQIKKNYIKDLEAKKAMDNLFLKDLRKNILKDSDSRFIMVKDTSVIGVDRQLKLFKDDIHILLIRDPKDVFSSLIKGMSLQERSFKNKIKTLGNLTGLYPWYYSRKLSRQVLDEFPEKDFNFLRYEDLVKKDDKTMQALKDLFNSKKSLTQIKKEIDDIQVINSSFYEEVGGKRIWDSKPKTDNFNPVNRKANSWIVRKGIELGSRKLRKKLNYI